MKISKENCLEILLEKFPILKPKLKEILKEWGEDHYPNELIFGDFADFVVELIQEGKISESELKEIFSFMEYALINGEGSIKDIVATCFLEDLLHATPGKISALTFVHLLGEESREYCKAWDEFTGVKTEGLWD